MTFDAGLSPTLVLAAIACFYSALVTLQTYEFRRFVRSRMRTRLGPSPAGRVILICPCRGAERNLAGNLRALLRQDHANYQVLFVVDSARDAACGPILRALRDHPQAEARLLVAGPTTHGGQKVHNLLAATAELPAEVRVLAFADSDARPPADWLRRLVERLDAPGVVAATGYRWLVPRRGTTANFLIHALDASVAGLVGPGLHHFVWGGAWAVRRDAFEASQLRSAWRGTLSDDLVAARALKPLGRVEFEPGAIVASRIGLSAPEALEFARRQFTIGRCYAPKLWALAGALAAVQHGAFWLGIAWLFAAPAAGGWAWAPPACALAIYALQVLRAWLREDAARWFRPECYAPMAAARRFAVWFGPLVGLLHCWALAGALASRRIRWRGLTYDIFPGGQARVAGRLSAIAAPARRPPPADTRQTRAARRSRLSTRASSHAHRPVGHAAQRRH